LPTIAERVAAWSPDASKKPTVLEDFPPDLAKLIIAKLFDIIRRRSPLEADKSREKEVRKAPGVTAGDINRDLLEELPWISIKYPKGFSEDVIRHFLSPPNAARGAKSQYRGFVKAKLAGGQNTKDLKLPRVHLLTLSS
jgi:hypothetical protein